MRQTMPEADIQTTKRSAILAGALRLFAEQGFHGVTVPEVAALAKVGAGTIYRYFASKEALVNALFQQHKTAMADALLKDIPPDTNPRELFRTIWGRAIAFARTNPHEVRFLELHHHGDYLDADSKKVQRRFEGVALAFVDRAQKLGAIKKVPPGVILALVWGGFAGTLKMYWGGQLKLTDEVIGACEQCLWEAIRL